VRDVISSDNPHTNMVQQQEWHLHRQNWLFLAALSCKDPVTISHPPPSWSWVWKL